MHCIHMFQIIIFVSFIPFFCLHSMAIFHANKKLNLTIMCNESGSNDVNGWAREPTQLRRKEFLKIFHAMSWNILGIFIFHMENFMWCGKIFHDKSWNILPHHVNDFLGSTIVYWLWTWVWLTKLLSATSCEGSKTKKKDAFHHP